MTEQQTKMWDVLSDLSGEEVLLVLTDWHGLQLLDEGFHGHLVDEGYIEEETNCENGTYDCDTCSLDGKCDRQEAMKSEDFDDFCGKFPTCKGCPLQNIPGDCEEDLWPKFKKEHGYG